MMLNIGTHVFSINPNIGEPMSGYKLYHKFIKGIHDPVFGNVLVLSNNNFTCAFIVLDELDIDKQLVTLMREEINKRTGISPANISIITNHTHSTSFTVREVIEDYTSPQIMPEGWDLHEVQNLTKTRRQRLLKMTAAATEIAYSSLKPAKVGFRKGYVEGVGKNRNQPDTGPVDNEVSVFRFEYKDGDAPVLLTNFSTHPTIAPPDNCLVSGDLVGATKRTVQDILSPYTQILYTTGAAGDVSTRFTRKGSTFDEVNRLGRILGLEIAKIAESITVFNEDIKLNLINSFVEIPIRKLPSKELADKMLQEISNELEMAKREHRDPEYIKKLLTNYEGAVVQQQLTTMHKTIFDLNKYRADIQILRIGDIKLIINPFELFSDISLHIKAKDKNAVLVCLSNDSLDYVPTEYAYKERSYESYITRWSPGTDKIIEEAFLNRLANI